MTIMKTALIAGTFLLTGVSLNAQDGCCGSNREVNRVFRDAATHESMAEKRKSFENPIANLKEPTPLNEEEKEEMMAERAKAMSIVERSEIIHFGSLVTLVPKRAVLHLPNHLRGVKGRVQGKRLVTWTEFYRSNRAWIDTVEVTRAQAEGREPLPEKITEDLEKRTKVVVAVMSGGPISVLPLEEPQEPVAEASNIDQS